MWILASVSLAVTVLTLALVVSRAFEVQVKAEVRKIREKYLHPPHTTDFGIIFLPTEGLFAEVLRRPGWAEAMQRDHRVVVSGPTTLAAPLNSGRAKSGTCAAR